MYKPNYKTNSRWTIVGQVSVYVSVVRVECWGQRTHVEVAPDEANHPTRERYLEAPSPGRKEIYTDQK
jgi:hypothetical protein